MLMELKVKFVSDTMTPEELRTELAEKLVLGRELLERLANNKFKKGEISIYSSYLMVLPLS